MHSLNAMKTIAVNKVKEKEWTNFNEITGSHYSKKTSLIIY